MPSFSRPWSRPAIPLVVLLVTSGTATAASAETRLMAGPRSGETQATCTVRLGPDPFDAGALTETIALAGQVGIEPAGTVELDEARVRADIAVVGIELTGSSTLFEGRVALGQSAPSTGFVVHTPGKHVPAESAIDARLRLDTPGGPLRADAPISLSAQIETAAQSIAATDTSFAPVTWGFASGPVALRNTSGDLVGWIIDHKMTISFAGSGAPIAPTTPWGIAGPSALLVLAGAGLLLWRH